WGYYRRAEPFTRDGDWVAEQERLLKTYFPQRTAVVLEQLRAAGLYPKVDAPTLKQQSVGAGNVMQVTLAAPQGGRLYYTTNGADPRVARSGAVAAQALGYSNTLQVAAPVTLRARVLKSGSWSALVEAELTNAVRKP